MAKKTYVKSKKPKYSEHEKRAYYVGYGIALANSKDESGMNNGEKFLRSGYMPSVKSANEGYSRAMQVKDNAVKRNNPFVPPKDRF